MIERLAIVVILALLVALVSLLVRARARTRANQAHGQAIPSQLLSDAALQGPSVLYFFGPHCALCRQQATVLDALEAQAGTPVTRVDAAQHTELARSLGIMTVPATAILERGRVRTVNLGPRSLQDLQSQLAG